MEHPWQAMPLEVYEEHMSQVTQLQMLNKIMESQWQAYPQAVSAAVLGVAGGNGLEYSGKLETVYGIDINPEYLRECSRRFGDMLGDRLKLLWMDLTDSEVELPKVDLLLANLLIEYVGTKIFCQKAAQSQAKYITCVVQAVDTDQPFVSASPYRAQFDAISKLHSDVDRNSLCTELMAYGYQEVLHEEIVLTDGKRFLRLDFSQSQAPGYRRWVRG